MESRTKVHRIEDLRPLQLWGLPKSQYIYFGGGGPHAAVARGLVGALLCCGTSVGRAYKLVARLWGPDLVVVRVLGGLLVVRLLWAY